MSYAFSTDQASSACASNCFLYSLSPESPFHTVQEGRESACILNKCIYEARCYYIRSRVKRQREIKPYKQGQQNLLTKSLILQGTKGLSVSGFFGIIFHSCCIKLFFWAESEELLFLQAIKQVLKKSEHQEIKSSWTD